MTAIMDHHGRNRTGIEERLVMMVPDEAQVPDDEKLGWILDRLAADPDYDWAAQVERTRLARSARRASRSLDHENSLTRAPRLTEPGTILGIWQHINHRELRDQRKAAFLASEALYDLTVYETGTLTQIAEHLYQAHGTLLLSDWAAECASPGITSLTPADNLRLSLPLIREAVRVWVTALAAAVPYEGDRTILQRRLGLSGGDPEVLQDIAEDLGISRERVRQRQERAPPTSTFCPAAGLPVITRPQPAQRRPAVRTGSRPGTAPSAARVSAPGPITAAVVCENVKNTKQYRDTTAVNTSACSFRRRSPSPIMPR
ncbi:MAG: sigma factor-like helix-turn-helix DNA-binding protein [Streptosporangiaceae bacterium]